MGLVGKILRKRRLVRRMPESSRKRKLGGNSRDHRPYFTYWVTYTQVGPSSKSSPELLVLTLLFLRQILIMFISLLFYGFGPIGVDLYKRSQMVRPLHCTMYMYCIVLYCIHYTVYCNHCCIQVLVTSLSLETVGYLEPANFWIGPAAVRYLHVFGGEILTQNLPPGHPRPEYQVPFV